MDHFLYFADEKFDEVIRVLNNRNYKKILLIEDNNEKKDLNYEECQLIFTNLAKINFKLLGNVENNLLINHLRGAQHLSNKSFLAYHIATSGNQYIMPPQWSSAYEDLCKLISILILDSLYNICQRLIKKSSIIDNDIELCNNIELYKTILNALKMDPDWLSYKEIKLSLNIISILNNKDGYKDVISIQDEMNNIEIYQPWRKRWGGNRNIWIIKPVGLSCGENIMVVDGVKNILHVAKEMSYKCLVQKYIERPLLLRNNRKFDIRQWILVTNVNPLVMYGFSECYLRLSSQSYSLDESKLLDPKIHLCNHSIQKQGLNLTSSSSSPSKLLNSNNNEYHCDTMMSQNEFNIELIKIIKEKSSKSISINDDQPFNNILLPKMKQLAIDTVLSVRDKLFKVNNGFEWLGLDVLVTEDELDLLLLEVNVSPDISHSTSITSRLVTFGVKDLFDLIIDEEAIIKSQSSNFIGEISYPPRHKLQEVKHDCINKDSSSCELYDDIIINDKNNGNNNNLKWDLWYNGSMNSVNDIKEFTRSKSNIDILGSDYSPRKENICNRVISILDNKQGLDSNVIDDNSDDDEL